MNTTTVEIPAVTTAELAHHYHLTWVEEANKKEKALRDNLKSPSPEEMREVIRNTNSSKVDECGAYLTYNPNNQGETK